MEKLSGEAATTILSIISSPGGAWMVAQRHSNCCYRDPTLFEFSIAILVSSLLLYLAVTVFYWLTECESLVDALSNQWRWIRKIRILRKSK